MVELNENKLALRKDGKTFDVLTTTGRLEHIFELTVHQDVDWAASGLAVVTAVFLAEMPIADDA